MDEDDAYRLYQKYVDMGWIDSAKSIARATLIKDRLIDFLKLAIENDSPLLTEVLLENHSEFAVPASLIDSCKSDRVSAVVVEHNLRWHSSLPEPEANTWIDKEMKHFENISKGLNPE